MLKKDQTNQPKIIPMEVDNSKVVPMIADDSGIIPMEVQPGIYQIDEPSGIEINLPTKTAFRDLTYSQGGMTPSTIKLVGEEGNEVLPELAPVTEIQSLVQVLVAKGDEVNFNGKKTKVVEIIDTNRFHLKNVNPPYDSFVVTQEEINQSKKGV